MGDDVRQGRAGEQLEAALGIADAGGGGRGHELQEQVEGVHEEVAELGALDDGVAADEVSAGPDRDGAPALVLRFLACRHQLTQVRDVTGPVRVREHNVLAPCVPHPMCHRPALAPVRRQRHHPYRPCGDLDRRLRPVRPRP